MGGRWCGMRALGVSFSNDFHVLATPRRAQRRCLAALGRVQPGMRRAGSVPSRRREHAAGTYLEQHMMSWRLGRAGGGAASATRVEPARHRSFS